jgi:hypothetical protein
MDEKLLERIETLEKNVRRALDIQEIKNLMARELYYHAANKEYLEETYALKTPGVAIEYNDGTHIRFEGAEAIRASKEEQKGMFGQSHLQGMRSLYPWIEDDPKNEYIGMSTFHYLTTDCIEIAEDGQTAKAAWASPGYLTQFWGGKLRAYWHFDRYGIDFVKEDSKWKIWHRHVYRDFLTPFEQSWVENSLNPESVGRPLPPLQAGAGPGTDTENAPYYPFKVSKLLPKPPEPYKTFSETFSY